MELTLCIIAAIMGFRALFELVAYISNRCTQSRCHREGKEISLQTLQLQREVNERSHSDLVKLCKDLKEFKASVESEVKELASLYAKALKSIAELESPIQDATYAICSEIKPKLSIIEEDLDSNTEDVERHGELIQELVEKQKILSALDQENGDLILHILGMLRAAARSEITPEEMDKQITALEVLPEPSTKEDVDA